MQRMQIFTVLFSVLISATSQARTITFEVPDNVFSPDTTFTTNFDGSVNVINPKVWVNGKYERLAGFSATMTAVCRFLQMERAGDEYKVSIAPRGTVLIWLDDGKIHRILESDGISRDGYSNNYQLDSVLCRKEN